jgi:hypothetical protein
VNASRLRSRTEPPCITRGRGGWLDGGLAPPILCPLSWRTLQWVKGAGSTGWLAYPDDARSRRVGSDVGGGPSAAIVASFLAARTDVRFRSCCRRDVPKSPPLSGSLCAVGRHRLSKTLFCGLFTCGFARPPRASTCSISRGAPRKRAGNPELGVPAGRPISWFGGLRRCRSGGVTQSHKNSGGFTCTT